MALRAASSLFSDGAASMPTMSREQWELRLLQQLGTALDGDQPLARKPDLRKFLHESDKRLPVDNRRWDFLGPVGPRCAHLEIYGTQRERAGLVDTEAKRACGLSRLPQCIVFSVGSNDQWSFETQLVQQTNCTVHVFDCTMHASVRPPSAIGHRVTLHRKCLGTAPPEPRRQILRVPRDAEGKASWSRRYWASMEGEMPSAFESFEQLVRRAGIDRAPDLFKMDAEGYEWSELPKIVASPLAPQQLAVEMHYQTQMPGLPWFGRLKEPAEILSFGMIMARRGYRLVARHDNHGCKWCTEVLWRREPLSSKASHRSSHASSRRGYVPAWLLSLWTRLWHGYTSG